jgi:DNA-binding GntR family transcriptional regulator
MQIGRKRDGSIKMKSGSHAALAPSRLQSELAARILHLLKEQGAGPGHHLVEQELCQNFGVSRTPVRGALKLLALQGAVEARTNRGFVLRGPVTTAPQVETVNLQDEEDKELLVAIAEARNSGRLPAECTQQEMVRVFGAKLPAVGRVLRRLSELGLVERKPGNGWSFIASINSASAQAESYAYRKVMEPAALLQPDFELDREWVRACRARHMVFKRKAWRGTLAVEFFEMNADFHEQLARCSGNRYMLDAMQRQNQVRSFLNYNWAYGVNRVRASIEEHLSILDALEAGQNQHGAELMRAHLDSAKGVSQVPRSSSAGARSIK